MLDGAHAAAARWPLAWVELLTAGERAPRLHARRRAGPLRVRRRRPPARGGCAPARCRWASSAPRDDRGAGADRQLRHGVLIAPCWRQTEEQAMAVQVSYPGVYIEEFAPGAPIQGVGTSTAALHRHRRARPAQRADQGHLVGRVHGRVRRAAGARAATSGTRCAASSRTAARSATSCAPATAATRRMTLNDRTTAPGRPVVDLHARQPGALGISVERGRRAAARPASRSTGRPARCRRPPRRARWKSRVAAEGAISAASVANRFKPGDEVSFSTGTDRRVVSQRQRRDGALRPCR